MELPNYIFKLIQAENGWVIKVSDMDGNKFGYVVSEDIDQALKAISDLVHGDTDFEGMFEAN